MTERILVVGGTGPTGINIVRGLVDGGAAVTLLHRGLHERPETPEGLLHLHTDPFQPEGVRDLLDTEQGSFDVVLCMYGRLRALAEVFRGRCGRFLSVGGVPAHRGWMNPWLYDPPGVPVPVPEDGPTVLEPADDEKGYRVARTEEIVFTHHPDATHFRYPYMYGPYQPVPREWSIVRRVRDGRDRIVVADGGLTLHHHGFTRNVAHAVLLAIAQPERAAGRVYNVGDEEVLTISQVVEICARALGAELEQVSMPYDLAVPARPLMTQPLPTHRVLDLTRIRSELGYADVVPARRAVAETARWLAEHPPAPDGPEAKVLGDPFDYRAEDALIGRWQAARGKVGDVTYEVTPTYGSAYSGPGSRPRTRAGFET
ncbi:MAG TPA: hypothetical protein VGR90_03555 [Acidimicrobiales bacterium]|nr:hypothetical protein [Acidimicrobiales bacterium]